MAADWKSSVRREMSRQVAASVAETTHLTPQRQFSVNSPEGSLSLAEGGKPSQSEAVEKKLVFDRFFDSQPPSDPPLRSAAAGSEQREVPHDGAPQKADLPPKVPQEASEMENQKADLDLPPKVPQEASEMENQKADLPPKVPQEASEMEKAHTAEVAIGMKTEGEPEKPTSFCAGAGAEHIEKKTETVPAAAAATAAVGGKTAAAVTATEKKESEKATSPKKNSVSPVPEQAKASSALPATLPVSMRKPAAAPKVPVEPAEPAAAATESPKTAKTGSIEERLKRTASAGTLCESVDEDGQPLMTFPSMKRPAASRAPQKKPACSSSQPAKASGNSHGKKRPTSEAAESSAEPAHKKKKAQPEEPPTTSLANLAALAWTDGGDHKIAQVGDWQVKEYLRQSGKQQGEAYRLFTHVPSQTVYKSFKTAKAAGFTC